MENIFKGSCGESAEYSVDRDNDRVTLTVSGNGPMTDFINARESYMAQFRDIVTDVVIQPGITAVGGYTFCEFTNLENVTIPGTAKYLGCSCFTGAGKLEHITIPEGVEVIGPKSFYKCTALRDVSLPSTLRAVDFKAFLSDDAIEHVSYNGTATQWSRQVRVSMSALGNAPLLQAAVFDYAPLTTRYLAMAEKLAGIIASGGDGRFYIVAPDLTIPGCKGKSGDFLMLVFPDGQVMAIDAGLSDCGKHVMELIEALKIRRLDYFVASHPHGDHLGNALEMAKYFCEKTGGGVGTYLYSGLEYKRLESQLSDYLSRQGTVMRRDLRAGDVLDIGGVRIELFNPVDSDMTQSVSDDETVNNASLAMKFTYGESSFLSCGDLYAKREIELVEKYGSRLRADVLKTNHHGAFTSNTPAWYSAVAPKMLVSCCDDLVWTAFNERLAAAGIVNYRVSDYGLVEISMGRDADYAVETEYKI